jgi:tRNA(Arg) A34 adenosine deaminase TadA
VFRETELFVTLEPCVMCAGSLYHLGLGRLAFGASNPRFGGILSVAGNHRYGYPHQIEVNFI